jgi:hypothetical protein
LDNKVIDIVDTRWKYEDSRIHYLYNIFYFTSVEE